MSILNEVKRIFGVNGKSIEEALSNVPEGGAGGSGGTEMIEATLNTETGAITLTKTWNEIYALAESKKNIVIYRGSNEHFTYYPMTAIIRTSRGYVIGVLNTNGDTVEPLTFFAQTADDYPVSGNSDDGGIA